MTDDTESKVFAHTVRGEREAERAAHSIAGVIVAHYAIGYPLPPGIGRVSLDSDRGEASCELLMGGARAEAAAARIAGAISSNQYDGQHTDTENLPTAVRVALMDMSKGLSHLPFFDEDQFYNDALNWIQGIVTWAWPIIQALAEALTAKGVLTQDEHSQIVNGGLSELQQTALAGPRTTYLTPFGLHNR